MVEEVAGLGPSLDYNGQYSTNRLYWDKKQKRAFQRVNSFLVYWMGAGYQVLWVTLTTAPGGDPTLLSYHHKQLIQQIERKFGVSVEYFKVITAEGNGVIHALWGIKQKEAIWIPQRWLSETWNRFHGAPVVDIKRVRVGRHHRNRLSRYIVTQYVGNQKGLVRQSASWKKSFNFSLGKMWRLFCLTYSRDGLYRVLVPMWQAFLSGERIMLCGGLILSHECGRLKVTTVPGSNFSFL